MKVSGPRIAVYGGGYFNLLEPETTPVSIEAIANGLGNTCRFAGQCEGYYSVAEHSVWASYMVAPGFEYEALMHDSSEGLIHDITKPLKLTLSDYQKVEQRVETAFAAQYGFTVPMPDPVRTVDLRMLATEQMQIMGHTEEWLLAEGHKPFDDLQIRRFTPAYAKKLFLERYHELKGGK